MTVDAARWAERGLEWVASVSVAADGGLGWTEDGQLADDLYSGTAGVLLGCAEMSAAGLDGAGIAVGARDRLIHLSGLDPRAQALPDDGLFSGWAGVAAALRTWSDVTDDAAARNAADVVVDRMASQVIRHAGDPSACTDIISGDAGVLLALVDSSSTVARDAAELLADRLVRTAEPDLAGLHWRMTPDWPRLMPGFSHGTAGVAFALAMAGRRLDRPDLIDVAKQGAETLIALGNTPSGWAVPLVIPSEPRHPPVNYGWCHGPAGTLRLFVLLDEIEPDPRWSDAIDAGVRALVDSGLPARRYPGFWDNVARCCGTAGVGTFLLDRYEATGDPGLLEWVDRLAADVIARAVVTPNGATWSNTEHTATPPDLPPEPGFMQGTIGIVGWLARLDAAQRGRPVTASRPAWI